MAAGAGLKGCRTVRPVSCRLLQVAGKFAGGTATSSCPRFYLTIHHTDGRCVVQVLQVQVHRRGLGLRRQHQELLY